MADLSVLISAEGWQLEESLYGVARFVVSEATRTAGLVEPLRLVSSVSATLRLNNAVATIAGVDVTPRMRMGSVSIEQQQGQPDRCHFKITGTAPTAGQEIKIGLGDVIATANLVFAGSIISVSQVYEGRTSNLAWTCQCIDYTWLLNRRRPYGTFTGSASTIVQTLIANFSSGFTTQHVQADLPSVTIVCDGSDTFQAVLGKLATLVSGYWYVDYAKDLHFFTSETTDPPDPLDGTGTALQLDPPVTLESDLSQIRTRTTVQGAGSRILAPIAAAETIIPVETSAFYSSAGGSVISNGQILTYTGKTVAAPDVAPTLALAAGSGIEAGAHSYAHTFVTAAGETLPSPLASVTTVAALPAPSTAPTLVLNPESGLSGMDDGSHDYQVTFYDAGGETTPSPTSSSVTTSHRTITAPSSGPTAANSATGAAGLGWVIGDSLIAVYSYLGGAGVTTPSPNSNTVVAAILNAGPYPHALDVSVVGSSDPSVTQIRVWISVNGTYRGYRDVANATWTPVFEDISFAGSPPGANTAIVYSQTVTLNSLPIGGGATVGRKIYRRNGGAGTFNLAVTVANNTATTAGDNTPNASLGAAAPSSNTAVEQRVNVSAIAVGPSNVTSRNVYRTVAAGSQLKLLTTIADNVTTTYADSTADASLGANVPVTDTSALAVFGLSTTSGATSPGATTINVTSATSFQSGGGWALIGTSGVVIRYTGKGATTLTGVPATGNGSVTVTIPSGTLIQGAALLTGVPASGTGAVVNALNLGDVLDIFVQRNDTAAQATMSALDGGDGIYELQIADDSLTTIAQCQARADADLARFSTVTQLLTYATRDPNTRVGKTVTATLAAPTSISGTFTIQRVTIDQLDVAAGRMAPRYSVEAGRVLLTVDAWLQQFVQKG